MRFLYQWAYLLLVLACVLPSRSAAALLKLLAAPDVRPGLLVVLGGMDADPLAGLRLDGKFTVQLLSSDATAVAALRTKLADQNSYGSVSVQLHDAATLPYADNLVNVIVIGNFATLRKQGLSLTELLRALAPYGTIFLKGMTANEVPLSGYIKEALRVTALDGWLRLDKPYPFGDGGMVALSRQRCQRSCFV